MLKTIQQVFYTPGIRQLMTHRPDTDYDYHEWDDDWYYEEAEADVTSTIRKMKMHLCGRRLQG